MRLIFILLTLFCIHTAAKSQKQYLQKNKTYKVAKIYRTERSDKYEVRNLELTNDTLVTFDETKAGIINKVQISTNNIRYVSVKNGTHALAYGAVTGGAVLSIAAIATSATINDPNYEPERGKAAAVIVGFTAAGALVGGLVGALIPKWKTLSIRQKETTVSLILSPKIRKDYMGFGLVLDF
jgi:hypothetical protein